jgi:hypothetical protein
MSLPTSVSKPASGCVVLRVKRKREEDPAEALVIAKHNKLDTGTSVFHFVGTLREDVSDGVVLDRLKHYRDRSDCVKSNPFARLTLEDTKTQTRDRTKAKSSAQRFKVTSQLRCLQEGCGSSGGGDSCSPVTGDGERVAVATAVDTASGPTGVKIHICDVHQEDSAVEDWSVATNSRSLLLSDCSSYSSSFLTIIILYSTKTYFPPKFVPLSLQLYILVLSSITCRLSGATGAVTCNGSVMLREKAEHKQSGYVYDLYCTQEPRLLNMEAATFDWASLSVYEPELIHDIIDDMEETCDDEDDSNDEDNWRNDYPDEEGSTHSSDSELDNCGGYRHRQTLCSMFPN